MILLGKILGWLIVSAFTLAVLNYPVKALNRKLIGRLPAESGFRKGYQAFMKVIVRWHRFFALAAAALLLAHFLIQYTQYGFIRPSGVLAGALMLLQIGLGAFGHYIRKKKHTAWFYIHRTTAVLLLAAFAVHIFKIWWILR